MADTAQDPSLPQKKRARRRLVGAAVLCLGLAAGLPFLFDAEPKKNTKNVEEVKVSVAKPAAPTVTTPEVSAPAVVPAPALSSKDDLIKEVPKEEPKYDPKPDAKAETKVETKAETKVDTKVEPKKPAPATTVSDLIAKSDKPKETAKEAAKETSKAEKLASSADKSKADKPAKYLVQIGAFGSAVGAQEQVKRAAAIGLKAFTEDVDTNSGKRIRVRVGPFSSKDAADQAREKLKGAGIDSALIAP
jgi:DedD protein